MVEETFLDRLVSERNELEVKHGKLLKFLATDNAKKNVGDTQFKLLRLQAVCMKPYLDILTERIDDLIEK